MKITHQKRSENLIYILIWAIVLSLPVFTLKGSDEFNWNRVFLEWIRMLPFLMIFFINNSLLAPKLLFRNKLIWYLISIFALVLLFSLLNDFFKGPPQGRPRLPEGPPMMHGGPMGPFHDPSNLSPPIKNDKPFNYLIVENIIILFLVVGFNNAIKLGIKRQKEELQREEKEKIYLETELSFLRQQISPHFFMNTLNNIHALIEINQVQAQKSVIKLSKLMRYLLNESQQGYATIKDEFEFLTSYIDLMRIRYSDKVKIDIHLDVKEDQRKIPSLLFISLVENAFKYGVSYSNPSYIFISSEQKKGELHFEVKNSKSNKSNAKSSTGVGLINLRKQLNLLFGTNHVFNLIETDKEYHVKLIIPLQND